MKTGQTVLYVDPKGKRHEATVAAIAGTGASGLKTLDLALEAGEVKNVPHRDDRESGAGFWLLVGEEAPSAPVARRKAAK